VGDEGMTCFSSIMELFGRSEVLIRLSKRGVPRGLRRSKGIVQTVKESHAKLPSFAKRMNGLFFALLGARLLAFFTVSQQRTIFSRCSRTCLVAFRVSTTSLEFSTMNG